MNRFFDKLGVGSPVLRQNYTFQVIADKSSPLDPLDPDELAWSGTTLGPEGESPHLDHGEAFHFVR